MKLLIQPSGAANGAAFSLAWFALVTLIPGLLGLIWSLASPRERRPGAEPTA